MRANRHTARYILVTLSQAVFLQTTGSYAQTAPPPLTRDLGTPPEGVLVEPNPSPTPISVQKLLAENHALRIQMSDLIQSGAEAESLKEQNESLKAEISNLAAKLLELDEAGEMKGLEAATKAQVESLQGELQQRDNEIRSLRVELAGYVETATQLAKARAEVERLQSSQANFEEIQASLDAAQSESEKLRRQIAEQNSKLMELTNYQSKVDELNGQVETLQSEKEALVQEAQEQSQFLKQQVETLKLKNQAFNEAERNRQELLAQIEELQARAQALEEAKEEVAELRMEVSKLEAIQSASQTSTAEGSRPPVSQHLPSQMEGTITVPAGDPIVGTPHSGTVQSQPEQGFSRYEDDSSREALEQRIRDEIRKRRETYHKSSYTNP